MLRKQSHDFYHLCKREIRRAGNKKPIFLWLISKTKPFHQTLSSPQWHGKTQVSYYRVIGFYQWRVLSSYLVQRPPSQRRRESMTSLKSHSKFMAEARQDPGPLTVVLQYHCPRAISWGSRDLVGKENKANVAEEENQRCLANPQTEEWNPNRGDVIGSSESGEHLDMWADGWALWSHHDSLLKGDKECAALVTSLPKCFPGARDRGIGCALSNLFLKTTCGAGDTFTQGNRKLSPMGTQLVSGRPGTPTAFLIIKPELL